MHRRGATLAQIKALKEQFRATDKPDAATRRELSTRLSMTPRGVQVWFQNQRAKEKRLRLQAPSIPEREAYRGLYLPVSPSYSNLSHTGMQLSRDCAEPPQLMGEPTSAPAMMDCSLNAPSTIRNTQNNARWKVDEISSRLRLLAVNNYFLPPPRMHFTTTRPHLSLVSPQRSLLQLSTAKQTHRIKASFPAFTPQGRGRQIPVVRGSQLTINHIGLPRHQFTPMETRTVMPLAPGAPSSSAPAPTPPPPPPPPFLTWTPANDHLAVIMLLKQRVISPPYIAADALKFIYDSPSCPDPANCYGDCGSPCYMEFEVTGLREECSPYRTRRLEATGYTAFPYASSSWLNKEVVSLYRGLAVDGHEEYKSDLADALHNCGIILHMMGHLENALSFRHRSDTTRGLLLLLEKMDISSQHYHLLLTILAGVFELSPSRPDLVVNRYGVRGLSCFIGLRRHQAARGMFFEPTTAIRGSSQAPAFPPPPVFMCPNERHCLVSHSSPCRGRGLRVPTVFL